MGFIKRKFTRLDFGNYEFKKFQRELLEKKFLDYFVPFNWKYFWDDLKYIYI